MNGLFSAEPPSGVAVTRGVVAELARRVRLAPGETEAIAEVEAFILSCEAKQGCTLHPCTNSPDTAAPVSARTGGIAGARGRHRRPPPLSTARGLKFQPFQDLDWLVWWDRSQANGKRLPSARERPE